MAQCVGSLKKKKKWQDPITALLRALQHQSRALPSRCNSFNSPITWRGSTSWRCWAWQRTHGIVWFPAVRRVATIGSVKIYTFAHLPIYTDLPIDAWYWCEAKRSCRFRRKDSRGNWTRLKNNWVKESERFEVSVAEGRKKMKNEKLYRMKGQSRAWTKM